MKKMTKRQKEIYDFIKSYIKENGFAPTYIEIGERFGVTDSCAHITVRKIEKLGLVKMSRKPRMLQIL